MPKSKKGVATVRGGKEYKTVVLRVNEFRVRMPIDSYWGIDTYLVEMTEKYVIMVAKIINPDGRVVGSGYAQEFWGSSNVNKTSALENAETSAIGRALASCGLGGDEYASADEVLRAIEGQKRLDKSGAPSAMEEKTFDYEEAVEIKMKEVAQDEEDSSLDNDVETLYTSEDVNELIDRGCQTFGAEAYRDWHERILSNYFGCTSIADLDSPGIHAFAKMQKQKIQGGED